MGRTHDGQSAHGGAAHVGGGGADGAQSQLGQPLAQVGGVQEGGSVGAAEGQIAQRLQRGRLHIVGGAAYQLLHIGHWSCGNAERCRCWLLGNGMECCCQSAIIDSC